MKKNVGSFIKIVISVSMLYGIIFCVLNYTGELSKGVKNGINLSINLVIPSMFMFMLLANVIMSTKLSVYLALPFKKLAGFFLRLSPNELSIMLLSLIGGYPVGARLLSRAVEDGSLSSKRASKLLPLCVNCGPAFLIGGIGAGILGNSTIGLYIYISQITACLLVGFVLSRIMKNHDDFPHTNPIKMKKCKVKQACSAVFVSSVRDAVSSMAVICSFVVVFCAAIPFLEAIVGKLPTVLHGLLEVTAGCSALSDTKNPILLCALFTSFGGICVHLQIMAMLSQQKKVEHESKKISMRYFYLSRPFYVAISVLLTKLFLLISPVKAVSVGTVSVGTFGVDNATIYSVSPSATFFLILLSIMLLFFTKKSVKIKDS